MAEVNTIFLELHFYEMGKWSELRNIIYPLLWKVSTFIYVLKNKQNVL